MTKITRLTLTDLELCDIFEDMKISKNGLTDLKTIENNIIYILKRENLWNENLSIILFGSGSIGSGSMHSDSYQFDFQVLDKTIDDYIASGTCYGSGMLIKTTKKEPDDIFQVIDMQLEIHIESVERMKAESEKVIFT